jgi:hypothetical protein
MISFLVLCLFVPGCRNDQGKHAPAAYHAYDETDTTTYPKIIDGGTKIVYQFGHMTADKGLKLYYDTIPHPPAGFRLDDSIRRQLTVFRTETNQEPNQ